jgi:hypothetical protein
MKMEVKSKECDGQNFEFDIDALISKQRHAWVDQRGVIWCGEDGIWIWKLFDKFLNTLCEFV